MDLFICYFNTERDSFVKEYDPFSLVEIDVPEIYIND